MPELALPHIAWSKDQVPRHRFNLADSAVDTPDLEALGLPHRAGLPAAGYSLHAALERALGERLGAPGGRVLVTAGGSEANAAVFGALLERGDEALIETPGYEPHLEVPRLFGTVVRRFQRPLEPGRLGAAVEAALSPATRLIVLSDLHNPSGLALADVDVEVLDALAGRRGIRILCDEIFRDAGAGRPPGTRATRGPRWITTSSLTKSYGLGGLRIGWIAGAPDALAACAAVQNALSVQPALPSIALALELLPHLDTLRARTHRILAANRARWQEALGRTRAMPTPAPGASTTVWCRFEAAGAGDAFSAFASRHFDLAVTPGRFFGDPRGLRIALGGEPARFATALPVLEQAVTAFAGRTAPEHPLEAPPLAVPPVEESR